MKASIYEQLRQDDYDVHRCMPGSDGNCYYLISKRGVRDYGDKNGRIFKAVRETPFGDMEIGATLGLFVSRTAQAAARTKSLMGDFDDFVKKAGVAQLCELLQGDLSGTLRRDIELNSRSPKEAFVPPVEPDPLAEQQDLRFKILRILAEKHSAGLKRVSKDDLLEELCTNLDWVDRALVILREEKLVDGVLRGEMKLLPAGHLEAEKTIAQSESDLASMPQSIQTAGAATAEVPMTIGKDKSSRRAFDLFVSYASEDRSAVQSIVEVLEGRGFKVWWDRGQITLGDKLSAKIDEGLRNSQYGVVIISDSFIAKHWPESELRSMINRSTTSGEKVILPVLLGLTHEQFAERYPLLADTVTTQFDGDVDRLVDEISGAIGRHPPDLSRTAPSKRMLAREIPSPPDLRQPHGETVSSFLNSNDLLARLIPYGDVTKASDVVWENRPQAFLRLVPSEAIGPLTPKAVRDLIYSPPYGLPLFGRSEGSWFQDNEYGAVVFDARETGQTGASQMVQVFENGEIWAIDTRILSHGKNAQPAIPSITIEENFLQALTNFLIFARDHLRLSVPLRLIAGIDGVKGFSIAVRHGLAGNIVKDSIVHEAWIESYDVVPCECLLPLFKMIWEYAGLDRPDNLCGGS